MHKSPFGNTSRQLVDDSMTYRAKHRFLALREMLVAKQLRLKFCAPAPQRRSAEVLVRTSWYLGRVSDYLSEPDLEGNDT
jgi:hypothetical protein